MTDEQGFGMTERLVQAYVDFESNRKLIQENWPHASVEPDEQLLRFSTVENLQKMLQSRTNYLAPVLSWKDVYEGLTRNVTFQDQNKNKIDVSQITTSFYGQCWTLSKFDSELLWNARCSEAAQNGVCIRTTFGKLVRNFIRGIGMKAFEGKTILARANRVDYVGQSKYEKVSETFFKAIEASEGLSLADSQMLDYLMVKRESFSDEQEVRLVVDRGAIEGSVPRYLAPKKFSPCVSGLTYSVHEDDFLDEVVLDPRIETKKVIELKKLLEGDITHYGWQSNGHPLKVRQSDLYDKPERTITIAI